MIKTKYYLVRDCGDGSYFVDWFDSVEEANILLETDESYFGNDCVGEVSGINLQVG